MALVSINPYNLHTIKTYKTFTADQIAEALIEVETAFIDWKTLAFDQRAGYMKNLSRILKKDAGKYATLITSEMGKPLSEAKAEVEKCAWVCDYYAENSEKFLAEETIITDAAESKVWYEPLGVILGIMPWNFPFWQVFRFAAPTIMAGNTVLLKHASNVQGCALAIENILHEAGFPKGIFKTLVIESKQVNDILESNSVKAVSLTGSEKAGSIVASQAAEKIKKSVLELGGNNAFIILEDADIERALKVGIQARMQNGGQSCIAAKRFIIHEQVAEHFLEQFKSRLEQLTLGDPMQDETDIGPLASVDQAKTLEKQVLQSVEKGAKIITGGTRNEAFYTPTLITGAKPGMPVFDEETFGPVLAVSVVNNDDEAIKLANASTFGLGASIFTTNIPRAKKLARAIEDGAVFINALVKSDPRLPFGGTKRSGFGRELSHHGIKEFVNVKTVYIQ